jgi:hypothetical protein
MFSALVLAIVFLLVSASGSKARADDRCSRCEQLLEVGLAAEDVRVAIQELKVALVNSGEPKARSVFSLLNGLEAKARRIQGVVLVSMDEIALDQVLVVLFMQIAESAREDYKALLCELEPTNEPKSMQCDLLVALQADSSVEAGTNEVISRTQTLLAVLADLCLDCFD